MNHTRGAMKEGKIEYLQMIQEPICRMSTISAIFKGFAATIVSGIALISYTSTHVLVIGFSFLPVVAFAFLDIYYLKLERKYRFLYEQVRHDEHEVNYSMSIILNKKEEKKAKSRVVDCVKSPSIYLFYPIMIAILLIVLFLKINNLI